MKKLRNQLISSILVLVLCFTSLIGATFAWFTDSVTSSGNKIQSGTLKVDLELLDKESGLWNSIKETEAPIFTYQNWEPGYTDVTLLKVENEGNLALKWEARFFSETPVSDLAKVIDVYVKPSATPLTYPTDRTDISAANGWNMVGTLDQFIDTLTTTTYGSLKAYESAYLGIALHMQEGAGNEYQNLTLGTFDIHVLATQDTFESDSFGDDYDNSATWPNLKMNFEKKQSLSGVNIVNGELAEELIIRHEQSGAYAVLPAGVKVKPGVTELSFSGKDLNGASGNITSSTKSYDIHIEGIADGNDKCITVYIGAILDAGLSDTALKLYHETEQMTRVNSVSDFAINNQYTYDSATGAVVLYVDSFSVFSGVEIEADLWDGTSDTAWYNENVTEFTLTTAEQLAGFRDLVDGGKTFAGKTVKLGADIDLDNKLFDPIGLGYDTTFNGTFDGQKHTVYNLYQNGWDLGYSYSTAGGGLFASVKNATVKNIAMSGANIVMECIDMGTVVGYAQGTCRFENIIVTNSKLANYQRYTGGVVGEVSYGPYGTDVSKGYSHTFENIVVDSSVKISSLWGDFDNACGGVIGGKWGDATVKMTNVTVACEIDAFSDVTAAYQWYAYRRCGMLIGHTEQNSPKKALNAAADFLTCENVNVYYGDWVNYHYYEYENQESETGRRYPWVRAEAGEHNSAFSNPRYGVPTHSGVKVTGLENSTDYTPIVFNQLYGGGQGVYGAADHTGVTVTNKQPKTIYIQNNLGWTDLKLEYWCAHSGNVWTTIVDGVALEEVGTLNGSALYEVEIPVYADGFKIIAANDNKTAEKSLSDVEAGYAYDLNWNHVHAYVDFKCVCGADQPGSEIVSNASNVKFSVPTGNGNFLYVTSEGEGEETNNFLRFQRINSGALAQMNFKELPDINNATRYVYDFDFRWGGAFNDGKNRAFYLAPYDGSGGTTHTKNWHQLNTTISFVTDSISTLNYNESGRVLEQGVWYNLCYIFTVTETGQTVEIFLDSNRVQTKTFTGSGNPYLNWYFNGDYTPNNITVDIDNYKYSADAIEPGVYTAEEDKYQQITKVGTIVRVNSSANVSLSTTTDREKGTVYQFSKTVASGSDLNLTFDAKKVTGASKTVFEADVNISKDSKGEFYIGFKSKSKGYAYYTYIDGTTITDFSKATSTRKSGTSSAMAKGKWFTIRMEYVYNEDETVTVTTYVNDKAILTSDNYYPSTGAYTADLVDMLCMNFGAAGTGTVLIDNVKVYQE